jgi:hypothetical protein
MRNAIKVESATLAVDTAFDPISRDQDVVARWPRLSSTQRLRWSACNATTHKSINVNGLSIFYRGAGSSDAPTRPQSPNIFGMPETAKPVVGALPNGFHLERTGQPTYLDRHSPPSGAGRRHRQNEDTRFTETPAKTSGGPLGTARLDAGASLRDDQDPAGHANPRVRPGATQPGPAPDVPGRRDGGLVVLTAPERCSTGPPRSIEAQTAEKGGVSPALFRSN